MLASERNRRATCDRPTSISDSLRVRSSATKTPSPFTSRAGGRNPFWLGHSLVDRKRKSLVVTTGVRRPRKIAWQGYRIPPETILVDNESVASEWMDSASGNWKFEETASCSRLGRSGSLVVRQLTTKRSSTSRNRSLASSQLSAPITRPWFAKTKTSGEQLSDAWISLASAPPEGVYRIQLHFSPSIRSRR